MRAQEERVDTWLFDLLDRRLSAHAPCLITTNLPVDSMAGGPSAMKHEPFVRRLLELSRVVRFT
jgi:hypothetical protein